MKFAHYVVALMLSGLVVLASVFVPIVVSSTSDLVEVKLGGPLPFLLQEQTDYDLSWPWQVYFYSLEIPTRILWPQLLLDVALVFGAIVVILRVILATSSLLPQHLLDLLPQFLQPPRSEPMKAVYHLGALVISGLLVLASVFVPITVSSKIDLAQMKLGLPLPFVIQNQSRYDPPFPWQFGFEFNPWETPTWILLPQFLIDVALVFGVIVVTIRVIEEVLLKTPLLRRQ